MLSTFFETGSSTETHQLTQVLDYRLFIYFLVFQDRFSLCTFGACPGTHSVDQLASNSQRSVCLCLPSAGIRGVCLHHLAHS